MLKKIVFLGLFVFAATPALADAMKWSTLVDGSTMTIRNGDVDAPVAAFDPQVYFDPTDLGNSRVTINASFSSAFAPGKELGSADNRALLRLQKNSGLVDAKSATTAVFTSTAIHKLDRNKFSMTGTLAINGRSHAAEIPFTVAMAQDARGGAKLVMDGAFAFSPKDFLGPKVIDPGVPQIPVTFHFEEIPSP